MKIEWTDLGDGFQVWLVDGRPVLVRDTRATNPHIANASLFRHDELVELIDGVCGWRMRGTFINHQTQAVIQLARVHQVDYTEFKDMPVEYEHDRERAGKYCELTGIPAFSGIYRLEKPWGGHPRGTLLLWCSGHGKRPGVVGAIEQRSLESILAMTVQMIEAEVTPMKRPSELRPGMTVLIHAVRMGEPGCGGEAGNPDVLEAEGNILNEDGKPSISRGQRFVIERLAEREQVKAHVLDDQGRKENQLFVKADQSALLKGRWLDVYQSPVRLGTRSCNLHDDCHAAEEQAKKEGKPEKYGPGSSRLHHCHDEGCEDCFGS